MKLLDRDTFRESVFKRDKYKCVICGDNAKDAHHIIERRLFPDGGYYLDNGASVCEKCHLDAESTILSCTRLREAVGITKVVLPPHLYADEQYDKWGNIILPNGTRLKGELFEDENVQKIIGPVKHLFTEYVKYPRTYHLPWSPGRTDDDRVLDSTSIFYNKEVVVTEKMDGENTTMYCDHIHARSLDSSSHESRTWVKQFHASIAHDIPKGYRICGENLYAKHAISYMNLPSYFMGFSIWNDHNVCLDWDTTIEYFDLFGITTVPVLYRGLYDEEAIKSLDLDNTMQEGYVLRLVSEFSYRDFRNAVAKYVRAEHVKENEHWIRHWSKNGLK